jgi:hypothetical protein
MLFLTKGKGRRSFLHLPKKSTSGAQRRESANLPTSSSLRAVTEKGNVRGSVYAAKERIVSELFRVKKIGDRVRIFLNSNPATVQKSLDSFREIELKKISSYHEREEAMAKYLTGGEKIDTETRQYFEDEYVAARQLHTELMRAAKAAAGTDKHNDLKEDADHVGNIMNKHLMLLGPRSIANLNRGEGQDDEVQVQGGANQEGQEGNGNVVNRQGGIQNLDDDRDWVLTAGITGILLLILWMLFGEKMKKRWAKYRTNVQEKKVQRAADFQSSVNAATKGGGGKKGNVV